MNGQNNYQAFRERVFDAEASARLPLKVPHEAISRCCEMGSAEAAPQYREARWRPANSWIAGRLPDTRGNRCGRRAARCCAVLGRIATLLANLSEVVAASYSRRGRRAVACNLGRSRIGCERRYRVWVYLTLGDHCEERIGPFFSLSWASCSPRPWRPHPAATTPCTRFWPRWPVTRSCVSTRRHEPTPFTASSRLCSPIPSSMPRAEPTSPRGPCAP
jgi:hypothetical protein